MKEKLVLIGNGMAGMRTVEELLKLNPDQYDITVFGAEPHGNYNRIMLSPVLAGEKKIDEIIIHDLQWYQDRDITLHVGKEITFIDRTKKCVVASDGSKTNYHRLLIATGSIAQKLPIPGTELPGVISFRDINDVTKMVEIAKVHKRAVVIGGGLLGLEAANGLILQGMDVSVVQRGETLMNQQLDQIASDLMQKQLESKGFNFLKNRDTTEIVGKDRVERVLFKDGSSIDTDLVVFAIGVRPNIKLAENSGVKCEKGILVDDTLQTYTPGIYAVGECVQHRDITFGLVAPLYEQAKVCANHLAEYGIASYLTAQTSTKLKVSGIDLFSAGDFMGDDTTETLVYSDPARYIYKKLIIKDNRIKGILLYGDVIDSLWYFSLLEDEADISSIRENIIFGKQHV